MGLLNIGRNISGAGYVILNCVRVMNVVALLAVIIASFVMLVRTFVVSKFFIFDGFSHIITAALGIFLVISELSAFKKYFANNWPLLSNESGFVTLGVLMVVLGVSILGNLNKDATSVSSLGLSFWQIVISSGIVSLTLGVINVVCSYIFRKKTLNVTARMVRAHGATAPQRAADIYHTSNGKGLPTHSSSFRTVVSDRRSFSAPMDRAPSYHGPSMKQRSSSSYSASQVGSAISSPIDHNPEQFAKLKGSDNVTRPESAAHPAYQGGGQRF